DEPVGESLGNVELVSRRGGELDAKPAETRRPGAEIHDRVPDRARGRADELDLRVGRRLPVHTAQGVRPRVVRHVALRVVGVQAALAELALAVGAREEAALVGVALDLEDEKAGERRIDEAHARILPAFRGPRYVHSRPDALPHAAP